MVTSHNGEGFTEEISLKPSLVSSMKPPKICLHCLKSKIHRVFVSLIFDVRWLGSITYSGLIRCRCVSHVLFYKFFIVAVIIIIVVIVISVLEEIKFACF